MTRDQQGSDFFGKNTGGGLKRLFLFGIPVVCLLSLIGFFVWGLYNDTRLIPSVLINKPLPEFALEAVPGRGHPLTSEALKGEVSLLNVFGSWCSACLQEHPTIRAIRQEGLVKIHGVDWREKDPQNGAAWLERHGDPYDLVGMDPESRLAIDLGITGAPETYLIDANGVIRYKYAGQITPEVWEKTLKPLVLQLRGEQK